MNQLIARTPASLAEHQLTRQVELFTEVIATDLSIAQKLVGSREDKQGFGRRREVGHAMDVAKVCAEVVIALAKLRGDTNLNINVRRMAEAEQPPLIEG